jgi:hypothetical protein
MEAADQRYPIYSSASVNGQTNLEAIAQTATSIETRHQLWGA